MLACEKEEKATLKMSSTILVHKKVSNFSENKTIFLQAKGKRGWEINLKRI